MPEGYLHARSPKEGTCIDISLISNESQAKGRATYNKALVHILESGDISIED